MVFITAPHLGASVILRDGRVTRGAPILKYMRGWKLAAVLAYAKKKNWSAQIAAFDPQNTP